MDFVAAVVADEQPFEVVEPGEGAFDDPAHLAEAGTVLRLATCDHRRDPADTEEATILVVVVATIGDNLSWSSAGPANGSPDGRNLVE